MARARFAARDHAGADGGVGHGIDQDEAPDRAVAAVRIAEDGLLGLDHDRADIVQSQLGARLLFQRVYVDAVADRIDRRPDRLRGVFEQVPVADLKLPFVHPHQARIQAAHDMRLMRRRHQHIAAADIDFIFEAERDGHRREGATELAIVSRRSISRGWCGRSATP